MSVIALDTLKYTKKLISAGVSPQQAEAQAEALAEITNEQLATKHDLKQLSHELMTKLSSVTVISITIATTLLGILISIHH